jgi:predicted anti-sigma-YlaC factor YlaD
MLIRFKERTMRCRKAERYISLKLDNQLSARAARALKEHLAKCSSCTEILREYSELSARLSRIPSPDHPQYLHHRIMSNLPQKKRRIALQRHGLGYAMASLAIVLSLWAGTVVGNMGIEPMDSQLSQAQSEYETISFGEHTLLEYYDD